MRLRWETAEPEAVARRFGRLLGVPVSAVHDRLEIPLGSGVLEVVASPAAAESASGSAEGRSAAVADERLRIAGLHERIVASDRRGFVLAGVAWATVDAERAAADLGWEMEPPRADRVLGASAHVVREDRRIVLAEPSTEGRIAASLARWGEGAAALWLAPSDSSRALEAVRDDLVGRGAGASAITATGFGRGFALLVGPAWGPHLVIVERGAALAPAGTIAP